MQSAISNWAIRKNPIRYSSGIASYRVQIPGHQYNHQLPRILLTQGQHLTNPAHFPLLLDFPPRIQISPTRLYYGLQKLIKHRSHCRHSRSSGCRQSCWTRTATWSRARARATSCSAGHGPAWCAPCTATTSASRAPTSTASTASTAPATVSCFCSFYFIFIIRWYIFESLRRMTILPLTFCVCMRMIGT